jgi:hypothetical protein
MTQLNDIACANMYDHKQILMTIQGVEYSLIKMGENFEIMNFDENEPRYLVGIEDLFEYFADQVKEGHVKYQVTRR